MSIIKTKHGSDVQNYNPGSFDNYYQSLSQTYDFYHKKSQS